MSWRVVVISNRCKLDFSMNYMVIRGEEKKRILIDEIAVLVLENNAVSMTGCLLSALIDKKVKVILCDEKRTPQAELVPLYGSHNDALKIKKQILWHKDTCTRVWTDIVREKIFNQAKVLGRHRKAEEERLLQSYINNLQWGDLTNREGHAAKVYFNAVFGLNFTRNDENDLRNAALNYGYSLLLSAFNREIVANGYLTQLGLGHDNQFNHFNLSSDLMEPFRVLVDIEVMEQNYITFESEEKHQLLSVLNRTVRVRGTEQVLLNAIKIYVKSVFDALNENDISLIKYFEF